jgi:DNA-binding transcriptional regulator YiaG
MTLDLGIKSTHVHEQKSLDQVNGSHILVAMDGKALKRRREALRYSQAKLAALLHVHTLTVSRWERGQHKVPESVALVIKSLKPKRRAKLRSK